MSPSARPCLPHRGDDRRALLRRPDAELGGALAQHLLAGKAGHLEERVVDVQIRPVGEAGDHRRLRIEVKDRLEPPLGCAQRLFCPMAIVHVEGGGHPLRDRAGLVADRRHATEVEPIGSLAGPDPILHLARAGGGERAFELPLHLSPVVGMDGDQRPLVAEGLLLGETGQLDPPLVHPLEAPLGVAGPDDLRKGVGQFLLVSVHAGTSRSRSEKRSPHRRIRWPHSNGV